MRRLSHWFDILLQAVTLVLLVGLTVVVLLGISFRYSGYSLIWYDEAASVLLAWITFTGAALAMHRSAHLGFNGLLFGLNLAGRLALFWSVEVLVLGTLAVVAWAGWAILDIFGNETLTTLRFLPRSFVQGILPVSAVLMIVGRILTAPRRLAATVEGRNPELIEIEEEISRAELEHRRTETELRR